LDTHFLHIKMGTEFGVNVMAFHLQNINGIPCIHITRSDCGRNKQNACKNGNETGEIILTLNIGGLSVRIPKDTVKKIIFEHCGIHDTIKGMDYCFENPWKKAEILPTLQQCVEIFIGGVGCNRITGVFPKNVDLFYENFENPTESEEETSASENESENQTDDPSWSEEEGGTTESGSETESEEEEKYIRLSGKKRHNMQESDVIESDEEGEFQIPVRSKAKRKRFGRCIFSESDSEEE
jgi:hypothetical protein